MRFRTSPEALAKKKDNAEHWIDRDPELKCYLPGIPRAMYLPYPFQIVQSTNKIQMVFEFSNASRIIHLDKVEEPPDDSYMGHSLGRWEGDTLVVNVMHFNDKTWFDRAGNFHSDQLRVVERFTLLAHPRHRELRSPDAIQYEATIEDPQVFTRPWKISMPLYRRLEPNARLIEYRCIEFVERCSRPTPSSTKPPSRILRYLRGHGRSACPSIGVWSRMHDSSSTAALSLSKSSCLDMFGSSN